MHHAAARQRFRSQNCENTSVSGRFLKFKMLFTWQARGFRHVANCMAGAGVREGRKNIGRRGFEEGQHAQFVEGLQILDWIPERMLCRDRHFAWQFQDFVCLGFFLPGETYWNSEVKCVVDMSFLKEASQKSF